VEVTEAAEAMGVPSEALEAEEATADVDLLPADFREAPEPNTSSPVI
jgi:hypothetical protein